MLHRSCVVVLCSVLFLGSLSAANGEDWVSTISLEGAQSDLDTFVSLMNGYSRFQQPTDQWFITPAPSGNLLSFRHEGTGASTFGSLAMASATTQATWILEIGRDQPGVLIGGWGKDTNPHRQSVDLNDLLVFPQASQWLSTQASTLIHEFTEGAHGSVGAGILADDPNFLASHDKGRTDENWVMFFEGGRGIRLPDPETGTPRQQVAPDTIEFMIPFAGGGDLYDQVLRVRTRDGGSFELADIRRGYVDVGVPFSGNSRDIVVESVTYVLVPEPSSLSLLAAGGLCLLASMWRRRKAA